MPGPDPTFDAPAMGATQAKAARQVGGTMEDFSREVSKQVASGELTPERAQVKLKRAAGILPKR